MRCTRHSRLYCVAGVCIDERNRKRESNSSHSPDYDPTLDIPILASIYDETSRSGSHERNLDH